MPTSSLGAGSFAGEVICGHQRSIRRGYRFFCLLSCLAFARFGALDGGPSRRLRAWAFRRFSSCCGCVGFGRFVAMMSPSIEHPRLEHKRLNKRRTPRRSASITCSGRAFCVGPLQTIRPDFLILARHLWLEERRWQEALINHSTVLCTRTKSSGTEDGFDTDGQPDSASPGPRPRGPSQQEHRRGYQSAYGRQSSRSHHEEDGSKSLAAQARTVLAAA